MLRGVCVSLSLLLSGIHSLEHEFGAAPDQCTTMAISGRAMEDGSAIATHNDDCNECDIRVTHVPAGHWEEGSKRPIFRTRPSYPRYLESPKNNIHGPEYLMGSEDSSIFKWPESEPVNHIPQVTHTYAYTLGNYPLQNEKQLSMGESTCASVFYTTSAYNLKTPGKAQMDINTLMEIAMERCDTAVCAIKLMGELAEKYGFFGSDPGSEEGGEVVSIADRTGNAWMFQVLSDDTGTSAVWAAQRVPDGHIAVVANGFTILEMDLDDEENFMASSNIFEVAERNKLWSKDSGVPFNFLQVYGADIKRHGFMITRRQWRIFSLAAPSQISSPYTDSRGSFGFGKDGNKPYPFSVKVDRKLKLSDIFDYTRDTFADTPFDLSKGIAAGPFGDVMRFEAMPRWVDPENGIDYPEETDTAVGFERAISLYRTVYASVAQARSHLPDEIGAVVWISPYAPHHSSYVPIYSAANAAPSSLGQGTQYKLHKESNYWAHTVVGNYVSRWYSYTIGDVRELQTALYKDVKKMQAQVEQEAQDMIYETSKDDGDDDGRRKLKSKTGVKGALGMLQKFHEEAAVSVRDRWWEFFWACLSKYRDQMIVVDPHASTFTPGAVQWMMYPRWWLEAVGYWGAPYTAAPGRNKALPVYPNSYPTLPSKNAYAEKYPAGIGAPYENTCYDSTACAEPSSPIVYVLGGLVVGVLMMILIQKCWSPKGGYSQIPDDVA